MASTGQQNDGRGSQTTAINHYDGIFKFVHVAEAQEFFKQARKHLAQRQWEEAEVAFNQAKVVAKDNAADVSTIDLILREIARYRENLIPVEVVARSVDWSVVSERPVCRFEEASDRLPQGVFLLTIGGGLQRRQLVGRKTLSTKWLDNRIPELFCSLVRPDMLLGELQTLRLTETGAVIFYLPLNHPEKLHVLQDIMAQGGLGSAPDATTLKGQGQGMAELTFPFPLLKAATRKEFTSPAEGWQVDNAYDDMLSNGETHIRRYTAEYLKSLGLNRPRLYDPACSTGVFLSSLKAALPQAYTIGQDLSKQMADVSRQRLDEAHHGNALVPKIELGSAQFVFIRFLNSEVVTSAEAEMLLPSLLKTVAVGGRMVVLGHTPVLLTSGHFRSLPGFQLERCVAADVEKKGIFQYYVLKRLA